MKYLILILLFGCGSADPCKSYCDTACNKLAYCDQYGWSEYEVLECTDECIEGIDRGKKVSDDEWLCGQREYEYISQSCEEFMGSLYYKRTPGNLTK